MVAAVVYYAIFIWKTSFLIAGTRYFSLFDDAMVSMRYARNLVRGYGLVWNPGEPPVEGFTNPLWTLVMAAVHLLPIPPHAISLAVQVLGAVILLAIMIVVRRIFERVTDNDSEARDSSVPQRASAAKAEPAGRRSFSTIPVLLVGFYYPLVNWTLQGVEVGLLALIVATAAWALLAGRNPGSIYTLLAFGTFVRMDFVVSIAAFAVTGSILDPRRRRRHVLIALIASLLALGVQTVARMYFFHDLLPNTYYLKLTGYPLGLRVIRGGWVLLLSIAHSNGLLVVLPVAAILLARGVARRRLIALLVPFVSQCAYSAWVGGDAWEETVSCNRYLAVAVPLALVATAWGVAAMARRLDARERLGAAPVTVLTLIVLFGIAPYRSTLFVEPPPYVEENRLLTTLGLAASKLSLPDARVAAAAAGAIGYYSERPIVDMLGKSDRHISRMPMWQATYQNPLTYFYPGHLKWNYAYSIGALRPDVVTQLWESGDQAEPYLHAYVSVDVTVGDAQVRLLARRGSTLVRWPPG